MRLRSTLLALLSLLLPSGNQSVSASEPLPKDFVIIDVRSKSEFDSGHVDGALNMEYQVIGNLIEEKVPDKDKVIYLYCRSGSRAGVALKTLKKMGYTKVENIRTLNKMKEKLEKLKTKE